MNVAWAAAATAEERMGTRGVLIVSVVAAACTRCERLQSVCGRKGTGDHGGGHLAR